MTTSTPRTDTHDRTAQAADAQRAGTLQKRLLIIEVFVAGATSLAIEMAASRLLAPSFGSSLFVWANIIGLILLYLTVGYYVGGVLSDRQPQSRVFYSIAALAALFTAAIPLLAAPVLTWSQQTFANDPNNPLGVFYGALMAVILLFAAPTILLGCVSPYAIRLSIEQVGRSGRTAGRLYAISTTGSIVGTFLPVLVTLPYLGTNLTFITFGALLLFFSIIGFLMPDKNAQGQS
ncbi:MAG TPA: fused MFS/spermidine synthase [Ktedonobacteraceae bacterium]|nr:fused MFS/spermidine synthase [Ktedonobacteraceae bacterium]